MKRFASTATTLLAAAVFGAVPASVHAQSAPSSNPVLARIWALGMDSSHTEHLSQVLFDSLGPRLQGTPNLKAAQDWLVASYAQLARPR